jgi:hypothetical protein
LCYMMRIVKCYHSYNILSYTFGMGSCPSAGWAHRQARLPDPLYRDSPLRFQPASSGNVRFEEYRRHK